MAEPLRHRQTKEAATDMFSLQPPRHISTLHTAAHIKGLNLRPVVGQLRTCVGRLPRSATARLPLSRRVRR
jgi:hypothetical protein